MASKLKYITLIQKESKYPDIYYCKIIKETKDHYETINVDDEDKKIERTLFTKSKYNTETLTEKECLSIFESALINVERKKMNAEFDLELANLNLKRTSEIVSGMFKR